MTLKAVKLTNFTSVLTSIMLTQIVLLDIYTYINDLINWLTGVSIELFIADLGLYMIIAIYKI